MSFTPASLEAAATAVTGLGDYISLHTASPGTTGTSEATGGSPAYARQETTWTAGAADGDVVGAQVTFDAPAGTYTHVGIWTAATSGTFVGFAAITPVVLGAQGSVLVTPTVSADNA